MIKNIFSNLQDEEIDCPVKQSSSPQNSSQPFLASSLTMETKQDQSSTQTVNESYGKKSAVYENYNRAETSAFLLRDYHNWIKSVLIVRYIKKTGYNMEDLRMWKNISVLDLGCGAGGDLLKWSINKKNGVKFYTGCDIVKESLEVAHSKSSRCHIPMNFIKNSASDPTEEFFKYIDKNLFFDLVSSQFVIHYLFSSKKEAEQLFSNITHKLCRDGYFICTTLDSEEVIKRYKKALKDGKTSFGNSLYSISFESGQDVDNQDFGVKYNFFLDGAVGEKEDKSIVYVPEYLVKRKVLIDLAWKYGLELREEKKIAEFYEDYVKDEEYSELLRNKFKFQSLENIPKEQREVSSLYKIYTFRKIKGVKMYDVERKFHKFESGKLFGCS